MGDSPQTLVGNTSSNTNVITRRHQYVDRYIDWKIVCRRCMGVYTAVQLCPCIAIGIIDYSLINEDDSPFFLGCVTIMRLQRSTMERVMLCRSHPLVDVAVWLGEARALSHRGANPFSCMIATKLNRRYCPNASLSHAMLVNPVKKPQRHGELSKSGDLTVSGKVGNSCKLS